MSRNFSVKNHRNALLCVRIISVQKSSRVHPRNPGANSGARESRNGQKKKKKTTKTTTILAKKCQLRPLFLPVPTFPRPTISAPGSPRMSRIEIWRLNFESSLEISQSDRKPRLLLCFRENRGDLTCVSQKPQNVSGRFRTR